MDEKKTAAELYSAAIMEAAAALAGAGFSVLSIAGLDAYTLQALDLGTYMPDSVKLCLTVVKERGDKANPPSDSGKIIDNPWKPKE
jgi:hypothetical protein